MKSWYRLLFKDSQDPSQVEQRLLAAEREAQQLRLELKEQERVLESLKRDLEKQRQNQTALIEESVRLEIERFLANAAMPASQLLTQAHLMEIDGKPLQAKDVLAVARRLVRALEDQGLAFQGDIGGTIQFDPNHHQPMSGKADFSPGQPAVVRFAGVTYQGKVIHKAAVQKQESN